MVDIFDEVEEDLRSDRARALARRYGALVIALAVLVVIAAGAWEAWRWYKAKQRAEVATAYVAAMRLEAGSDAESKLKARAAYDKVAAMGSDGYRTISRLREASLAADAGDMERANVLWDQVAGDGATDSLYRDLAGLVAVQRQIDKGDPKQLMSRLTPMLNAENPWNALAREAQALLQMRAGEVDSARKTLRDLTSDVTTPTGVRGRANLLLAKLGD